MKTKEDFKSFKMDKGNVKLLTGIEADLYVFTIEQLNEVLEYYHQEKLKETTANNQTAKEVLKSFLDNNEAQDAEVTGYGTYLSEPDVLLLMKRFASQKPVVKMPSDEEIEKWAHNFCDSLTNGNDNYIVSYMSMKFFRSQIKVVTK